LIKKPIHASLIIDQNCNMSCTYCYQKHKKSQKMTIDVLKNTIKFICNNYIYNIKNNLIEKDDIIVFWLFGGEPFLNKELIFNYLELISKNELKEKIHTQITTNGTIYDEEIRNKIYNFSSNNSISIQLSIDGIKEYHDKVRFYINNEGTYDDIEKNVELFKNSLDTSYKETNKIYIHGSINKTTIRALYSSWLYFSKKWNFPIWNKIIRDECWDEEDVDIYKNELAKISASILNDILLNKNLDILDLYSMFISVKDNILERVYSTHMCGCGINLVTIDTDGTIYYCSKFMQLEDKENYILGDIYLGIDDNKRKSLLKISWEDTNCYRLGCENYNCKVCVAENYKYTGCMVSSPINFYCKLMSVEKSIINNMRKILIQEKIL